MQAACSSSLPLSGRFQRSRDPARLCGNESGNCMSLSRLLKKADNKATGSAATEAYPCGTSQGDGRVSRLFQQPVRR